MALLGEVATLCLMISGILIMFGSQLGSRLFGGIVLLILLVPLTVGFVRACLQGNAESMPVVGCSGGTGSGLALFLLILLAWAYLRFLLRRRRLQALLGRPQTSLKRRVDRA